MEKILYTGGDAAIQAGVTISDIRWAMHRGDLKPTFRLRGKKPLFNKAAIRRFIKRLREKNGD